MAQDLSFLQADAQYSDGLASTALERLQRLVIRFEEEANEVEALEEKLAEAKKRYNKTSMEDIPEVLLGAGLSELRLADGRKVVVKEEISASVKDSTAFANFVKGRGDDDILKTTMVLGKLPDNILSSLKRLLAENLDLYPEVNQTVHSATLKKYVKEITGMGMENPAERLGERYIPMQELPECVSVFRFFKTTIKNK